MIRLFLLSVIALLLACQNDRQQNIRSNTLFQHISNDHTGIDFVNRITETEQLNFLNYPYMYNGGGVGIGDLNNDGLVDLYFTGNMVGDQLYFNRGNLQFEKASPASGILQTNLWTTGVTLVDVNHDGWLDIYVCRSGTRSFRQNLLYINQKDETFVESARAYGLNDSGYSVQACFFDYDLDGDLDMYLVNHSPQFFAPQDQLFAKKNRPSPSEADRLYENLNTQDSMTHPFFRDVSDPAGISHFGFGLSATVGDVNNDGWPDLYVANDFFEPDVLYVNSGSGYFIDSLQEYFGHISFSSMGSDMADFNNDGLMDIAVCDMQAPDNYRKKANMASMDTDQFNRMIAEGYHYQYMQNTLQLNTGMGRYSEIAELAGVSETDWSWGPLFCDLDNDGWKDLFISNGVRRDIQYKDILTEMGQTYDASNFKLMDMVEKFPVHRVNNYSFKNKGDLTFRDMSNSWGIDFAGFSTGAAYGDLDNDGDLELVLNNIDDPAAIFENLSDQKSQNNFIKIKLVGDFRNPFGVGATLKLSNKNLTQHHYVNYTRGFQSSMTDILFGLGREVTSLDLEVIWPDRSRTLLTSIEPNLTHTIVKEQTIAIEPTPQSLPLFAEVDLVNNFQLHDELPFDDFAREVLLPHKYSQLGPALAVGDLNGDQLDDFYLGGAKDQPGKVIIQSEQNQFQTLQSAVFQDDQQHEDVGAALFDADGDGDLDLYVASGSNEWPQGAPEYQDRLYLNDGHGVFSVATHQLPPLRTSTSCIQPVDIDSDGDQDLFIGGRLIPGRYPQAPRSYLLQNSNGSFSDQTEVYFGADFRPGMVTDAEWIDLDADDDLDLVLVGEWMPVIVYENREGSLQRVEAGGLEASHGWWYSLASGDFDGDGDSDLVVGNLGLNYKYRATPAEPFQVYAEDFDQNNVPDIVLSYFEDGVQYPLRGRQCSAEQVPSLKKKFTTYTDFASASLEDVYGQEKLDGALQLKAETFATSYVENLGTYKFQLRALPIPAQFSSVNAMLPMDLNHDDHLDLVVGGNMFGSEVETARNDASIGLVMMGDGTGAFTALPATQSGLHISGDVKNMAIINSAAGPAQLLVANNNAPIQLFRAGKLNL